MGNDCIRIQVNVCMNTYIFLVCGWGAGSTMIRFPLVFELKNYSDQFKFPKKNLNVTHVPTNIQPVRTLTLNGIRDSNFVPPEPSPF